MSEENPKPYVNPFDAKNAQDREARIAHAGLSKGGPKGPVDLMSRRDHFAAAAMQGFITQGVEFSVLYKNARHSADAMIKELDTGSKND